MSIFDRTFHPDEANQAFTTGRLIETGVYRYDPKDHHGPTLYYAAASIQKASGINSTAALDGTLLRCTPLLFAVIALVFIFLGLCRLLRKLSAGKLSALLFALLLASSPIFVFFATDFIQEMLLCAFTAMMFWAASGYLLHGSFKEKIKSGTWALLFGISAGLAFATKETAVLSFSAMIISLAAVRLTYRRPQGINSDPPPILKPFDMILAAAGFALTSILLYSSFASDWQGVYNAFVAAPLSYVHRAAGGAESQGAAYHVHPWWQYLKWLFSADAIFAAYVFTGISYGISILIRGKSEYGASPLLRAFAAVTCYSLILTAFYSAIPYKTPWCALQLHLPLLLGAFLGFAIFSSRAKLNRIVAAVFTALLLYHNCISCAKMCQNPDSKEIPYNYASASPQVKEMAKLIENIASEKQKNENTFVAVAVPAEDTWPLPFYLRGLDMRVGYWTTFEELEILAALKRKPDIIVVPAEDGHKVQPLFPHLKHTKRFEIRHKVRIRVFW